MQAEDRVID